MTKKAIHPKDVRPTTNAGALDWCQREGAEVRFHKDPDYPSNVSVQVFHGVERPPETGYGMNLLSAIKDLLDRERA